MSKQALKDAKEARYLRKQQKDAGYDEDEQEEDKVFRDDVEKALKTYGKGAATKDVQKQVEYFGYKIQPFNMKQEQELGEIDEEGFFLFSKKRQNRDAWLQSLQDNEEEGVIDNLRKKIKEEQRFQNVYDADPQERRQQKSENQEEPQQQKQQEEPESEERLKQDKFDGKQIKILLAQLLPFATTVNKYLKQLKKQKNNELYEKILYLCNEYIAATGEHDIFTMKKEDLQEELSQKEEEEPVKNWNEGVDENSSSNEAKNNDDPDEDDIF